MLKGGTVRAQEEGNKNGKSNLTDRIIKLTQTANRKPSIILRYKVREPYRPKY